MRQAIQKCLLIFFSIMLLFTSLPVGVLSAEAVEQSPEPYEIEPEIVNKSEALAKAYQIEQATIQGLLDEGYTAEEVNLALQLKDAESLTFEDALGSAKRVPLNRSEESSDSIVGEAPRLHQPLGEAYVANSMRAAAAANGPINPVNEETIKNVNTKVDQAPYKLDASSESVSTFDGSLNVSATDLMLPGRNGLSFALTRTYSSSDANYFDISTEYVFSSASYQVVIEAIVEKYEMMYSTVFNMNQVREYASCASGALETSRPIGVSTWVLNNQNRSQTEVSKQTDAMNRVKPQDSTPWSSCVSGYKKRDVFNYYANSPAQTVALAKHAVKIGEGKKETVVYEVYATEAEAIQSKQKLEQYFADYGYLVAYDWDQNMEYRYKKETPNAVQIKVIPFYTPKNRSDKTIHDKLFPIGKGWSWNIPYIKEGKYISLGSEGTYEINGSKLKGYQWDDLTFKTQTGSILVNGTNQSYAYSLSAMDGKQYYFDAAGKLLKITDAYNNFIDFGYTFVSAYNTNLLSSITDPIGNQIQISYSSTAVTLTYGDRTVSYQKTAITEQGKTIEILDRVLDPQNRTTRYRYKEKNDVRYNMIGSSLQSGVGNGYALLTTVIHPTGAETVYEYGETPVTRFVGPDAVMQTYRMQWREDRVLYQNPLTQQTTYEASNRMNITYTGDYASSYGSNATFSSTVDNVLSKTTYQFDKVYVSATLPTEYYLTRTEQIQSGLEITQQMTYDRTRRLTVPLSTTMTYKDTQSGASQTVSTSQQFDSLGNRLSSTNELGVTITYTYHPNTHLIQTITQPTSATETIFTEVTKTAQGDPDVVKVTGTNSSGPLWARYDYDYDSYGNLIRKTTNIDPADLSKVVVQNYEYGYQSAFLTRQYASGLDANNQAFTVEVKAEYNPLTGEMNAYTDGMQNKTMYQYDKIGRLTKVTNPDSTTSSIAYQDASNVMTQVNEAGAKTELRYNPLGLPDQIGLYVHGSYVAKNKYVYDAYGRKVVEEDALGNQTKTDYQPQSWGLRIVTTPPSGSPSIVEDNLITRTSTAMDGLGNQVATTRDIIQRPIQTSETKVHSATPSQTKVIQTEKLTYDYLGNVKTQENGANQVTHFSYDGLGRLSTVTTPLAETTSYTYDLTGNLLTLTAPDGSITKKSYDSLGRVIRSQKPASVEETYFYDGNGNVSKRQDANGHTLHYTYGARNQLLARSDGSQTDRFTYTADGLRQSMQDSTGTTSYVYDDATRKLVTVGFPDAKTVQYTYDERGNTKSLTGPFNDAATYAYDAQNRLTSINNGTEAAYGYYTNGMLKTITQGNGVVAAYQYTGLELTQLSYSGSGMSPVTYSYVYDDAKNISERSKNEGKDRFTYDAVNRIKTSTLNNEVYTYDARGNRESLEGDRLAELTDAAYTYDNYNRLTKVKRGTQGEVAYKYNGDGFMVERTEGGVTTRYYYSGNEIIAEGRVDANGTVTKIASYVRGIQLNSRTDHAGVKAYYMQNGHGDVEYVVDSSRKIVNQYTYDIWGNLTDKTETTGNPFLYAGEYWDSSTQLQYLRARWYDPGTGRFISRDTYEGELNSPLSQNLYTYVINNPLRYIDPSGNYCVSKDGDYAHSGACGDLRTSYWFSDEAGQMIVKNGILVGMSQNGGATRSYQNAIKKGQAIKWNAWYSTSKPTERNPGPVTEQNRHTNQTKIIELKNLGESWNNFNTKFQFNTSELGVYTSYSVYGNGIDLNFKNGNKLRVEFSIGNAEMGIYFDDKGSFFLGANFTAGIADFTYFNKINNSSYYLSFNISVSVLTYGAYVKNSGGTYKFHVALGEGGIGAGIGMTQIK
ncbi:RHS repeat domain-containing protein [Paenibacillus sp. GCM10012307]|uniref:RHS repeat protein n=1 Tax=Paenibacillus roseus TaxID=2798579 RepID=A0A934MRB9_9BACL|nr:RHS repeat protein [Paenibacillus roseus]MBJ6362738.1 RHS repeat protein [Paenibacillus roseus]